MENFSTILQTVWRPAQKNSWGGGLHQPPPPDRARVKIFILFFFNFDVPSSYRDRDNADNEAMSWNSEILENFALDDLWWPQFWPHIKMMLVLSLELVKTYRVLFFHMSMRFVVFELAGGGGGAHMCPPPPRLTRKLRNASTSGKALGRS